MTAPERPGVADDWWEIAAWDWVEVDGDDRAELHHLAILDAPYAAETGWLGPGRTTCGQAGLVSIPGLFTRMGAPRCAACCQATGMPPGTGSPKNDNACRPLVERELAAGAGRADETGEV